MMNGMTSWVLAAVLAVGGGWMAYSTTSAGTERPDCPGKVECPKSGEVICKDQCPLDEEKKEREEALKPCCVID